MSDDEIAMAVRRLLDDSTPARPAVVDPATCPHPHSWWNGSEVVCARCGEFTGGVERSQARHPSSLPAVEAERPLVVGLAALAAVAAMFVASMALTVWVVWRAADWAVGWFWQVIA